MEGALGTNLRIEVMLLDNLFEFGAAHNLFGDDAQAGVDVGGDGRLNILSWHFLRLDENEAAGLIDPGCFDAVKHGHCGNGEKREHHIQEPSPASGKNIFGSYPLFGDHFNSPNCPWSVVRCQLLNYQFLDTF